MPRPETRYGLAVMRNVGSASRALQHIHDSRLETADLAPRTPPARGGVRAPALSMRLQGSDRAADRLSSCPGRARRGRRVDEGHAARRVRTPPARGPVRSVRARIRGAARRPARRDAAVLFPVQAHTLLGAADRLKPDTTNDHA